jgi:hypothetical protein
VGWGHSYKVRRILGEPVRFIRIVQTVTGKSPTDERDDTILLEIYESKAKKRHHQNMEACSSPPQHSFYQFDDDSSKPRELNGIQWDNDEDKVMLYNTLLTVVSYAIHNILVYFPCDFYCGYVLSIALCCSLSIESFTNRERKRKSIAYIPQEDRRRVGTNQIVVSPITTHTDTIHIVSHSPERVPISLPTNGNGNSKS